DDGELNAGVRRGGAGFVPDDMRFVADDDLVTRLRQDFETDLVRHRAARHEQRGLFAEQFGDPLLQPVDRGVLAVLVVADRCRRHSLAHPGRRKGHGVGTKVDAVHARSWQSRTALYILPSWPVWTRAP